MSNIMNGTQKKPITVIVRMSTKKGARKMNTIMNIAAAKIPFHAFFRLSKMIFDAPSKVSLYSSGVMLVPCKDIGN